MTDDQGFEDFGGMTLTGVAAEEGRVTPTGAIARLRKILEWFYVRADEVLEDVGLEMRDVGVVGLDGDGEKIGFKVELLSPLADLEETDDPDDQDWHAVIDITSPKFGDFADVTIFPDIRQLRDLRDLLDRTLTELDRRNSKEGTPTR